MSSHSLVLRGFGVGGWHGDSSLGTASANARLVTLAATPVDMDMPGRLLMTVAAIVVVVRTASPTVGPRGQGFESAQQAPIFRTDTDLVVLHVMVTDKKGAHVPNLSSDAFRILEEGRPQPIQLFSSQDAPVTVGLLIDSSGSMQAARNLVIAAVGAFVETSNPLDQFFALAFNEDIRMVLPRGTPVHQRRG